MTEFNFRKYLYDSQFVNIYAARTECQKRVEHLEKIDDYNILFHKNNAITTVKRIDLLLESRNELHNLDKEIVMRIWELENKPAEIKAEDQQSE